MNSPVRPSPQSALLPGEPELVEIVWPVDPGKRIVFACSECGTPVAAKAVPHPEDVSQARCPNCGASFWLRRQTTSVQIYFDPPAE